jgi:hypothetical protein
MLKLACHCGFESDIVRAFVDHCLETRHLGFDLGADAAESGALAELETVLATIQQHAGAVQRGVELPLPEGVEIRPISREEILADEELSEDEKREILDRFDAIRREEDE